MQNMLTVLCFIAVSIIQTASLQVSSVEWWTAKEGCFDEDFIQLIKCLLCSVVSSSVVEGDFSTFGVVHSKLHNINRLGVAKAAKHVFLYRVLNVNIASDS